MLNRWVDDPSITTSNEFDRLLSRALSWQRLSRGIFNVSTRRLRNLWEQAAADGCQPSPGELHELAIEMAEAPYRFDGHLLRKVRDCGGLDLSAIAKGFGIEVAADTALTRCGLDELTVDAGDKIIHRGAGGVNVRIMALTDCVGAMPTFTLRNAVVAVLTSGQRGDDGRVVRVVDPRTGRTVDGSGSVAVVAPDATTADAVATIVSVLSPADALNFVDALNSPSRPRHPSEVLDHVASGAVQCWIVDARREAHYTGPR